jgi:hypothetical protein
MEIVSKPPRKKAMSFILVLLGHRWKVDFVKCISSQCCVVFTRTQMESRFCQMYQFPTLCRFLDFTNLNNLSRNMKIVRFLEVELSRSMNIDIVCNMDIVGFLEVELSRNMDIVRFLEVELSCSMDIDIVHNMDTVRFLEVELSRNMDISPLSSFCSIIAKSQLISWHGVVFFYCRYLTKLQLTSSILFFFH